MIDRRYLGRLEQTHLSWRWNIVAQHAPNHNPAWAGMRTHQLLHEVLVPVCHPRLLTGRKRPTTLDELPRLHRRWQHPEAWQHYAQETGVTLTNPAIGARHDLHGMLIEAALAGLGVALVPHLYVETELASGSLIAPWPEGKTISKTFCFIVPEPLKLSREPIQAFAQWLLDEGKNGTTVES